MVYNGDSYVAGETIREVRDVKMKPVTVEDLTHKFVLVSLLGDCLLCNAFGDQLALFVVGLGFRIENVNNRFTY